MFRNNLHSKNNCKKFKKKHWLEIPISIGCRVEGFLGKVVTYKNKNHCVRTNTHVQTRTYGTGIVLSEVGFKTWEVKSDFDGAILTCKFTELKVLNPHKLMKEKKNPYLHHLLLHHLLRRLPLLLYFLIISTILISIHQTKF